MGDHPRRWPANSPRAPARAASSARLVRGRRRQAVDLLVPGRGTGNIRRDARPIQRRLHGSRAGLARRVDCLRRSDRARLCCRRSMRCSAAKSRYRGLSSRSHADRARALARRAAGHRRNLAAGRCRSQTRSRRLGRPLRSRERNKPPGPPRRRDREACRELAGKGGKPGDMLDPGAPARRPVRADHPRAQGRRYPGRGRRSPGAHRAYRGHGPDRACRCAAAAARTILRSRPC